MNSNPNLTKLSFKLIGLFLLQLVLLSNSILPILAKSGGNNSNSNPKQQSTKTEDAGSGVHYILLVGLPNTTVQPNLSNTMKSEAQKQTTAASTEKSTSTKSP